MTLTIGRSDGLRVRSSSQSSDRWIISGFAEADDLDDLNARLAQLNGLRVGEVVPVIDTARPERAGFYSVVSVQAASRRPITNLLNSFEIELVRVVGGYSAAVVEQIQTFAARAAATELNPEVTSVVTCWPSAALAFTKLDGTYATPDGDLDLLHAQAGVVSQRRRFQATPAQFYTGTCLIERNVSGTWYPVVGRQIPSTDYDDLRISNGLVRLSLEGDLVAIERYVSGSGWTNKERFRIAQNPAGNIDYLFRAATPTIYRNDVGGVTVLWHLDDADGNEAYFHTLTVSIGVGSMVFDFYLQRVDGGIPSSVSPTHEDYDNSTTLSEQIHSTTGNLIQSTDTFDTDWKWVLLCVNEESGSADTLGTLWCEVSESKQFGIGYGADNFGGNDPVNTVVIAQMWMTAQSTTRRVVAT